jgi:GT2 family glycosyltransferase/glycosyltransferase involved in cell wall biosynthesis/SAM-dependent methyltransferase
MIARRRSGAPRLIEWTGERCVPWAPDVQVIYEHFHRYLWARQLVAGRRVLDLGSGEGFGAALLSEAAAEVVGLELDESAVEHATLNYESDRLRYEQGTALDLSRFAGEPFDVVVAFELIEHLKDHERLLSEIASVLSESGVLVISTPDRRLYSEASGNENPFHERELSREELTALIGSRFDHQALWGQRTVTGTRLDPVDQPESEQAATSDFFLDRAGDEWSPSSAPAAVYLVAVASNAPLPSIASHSTLSDPGLSLLRQGERDAADRVLAELGHTRRDDELQRRREVRERQRVAEEQLAQRDWDIARATADIEARDREIDQLREDVAAARFELGAAKDLTARVEQSVTWQAFQKARGSLYGAIGGEGSLLARLLSWSIRLAGSIVSVTSANRPAAPVEEPPPESIEFPQRERPEVSLVLLVHARADLTERCLATIRTYTTTVPYELIVVDDAADTECKALLDRLSGARVIRNRQNIGYLRSTNLGASHARGEWIVLLNNDVEVKDGWLPAMLDCGRSAEDIAVVTPKYLYPDGSLNEAGAVVWRDATGANYGRGEDPDKFQYEYRRETDYGSAAALLVKRSFWQEVGGFDERYLPMYYEDVDLCFEAREHGQRVLYEPDAVVIHHEGGTSGTDPTASHKRHQEENRPRFESKWRRRLQAEQLPPGPRNLRRAADRHRGPHALIVDHLVPMWDRDAGSVRMLAIIEALMGLDCRVTFMAENFGAPQPYTRRLQRMGVEVLYGALNMNAELATLGPSLSAAILSRPHPAGRWLDSVREFAPAAVVAYDTVDLHWLREARKSAADLVGAGAFAGGASTDLGAIGGKAETLRQLELALVRSADFTFVVSETEGEQVARDVPDARTVLIPMVHDVTPAPAPVDGRSGILFVGGFQHPPNTDAALRLVRDVMPVVWRSRPDVKLTIVGSDPPPEVLALASPRVDVAGWVEDIDPLLQDARMLVAPLRYGAGLKGKVTQAMAAGLPVVTTETGVEGLQGMESCALVAEEPEAIAAHVVRLLAEDELWADLSARGQELIGRTCSPEVISGRLAELLQGARQTGVTA